MGKIHKIIYYEKYVISDNNNNNKAWIVKNKKNKRWNVYLNVLDYRNILFSKKKKSNFLAL